MRLSHLFSIFPNYEKKNIQSILAVEKNHFLKLLQLWQCYVQMISKLTIKVNFTVKVPSLTRTFVGWTTFLANKSLMKKMEEILLPQKFSMSLERYFVILWKLTIHLPSKVCVLSNANRNRKFRSAGCVNANKCIIWHWYIRGKLLEFWWFIAFILPQFCSHFWIRMLSTFQRDDKNLKKK